MNTYRSEISIFEDNGKKGLFLLIEDNLTHEDENTLRNDGWNLLSNGTMFDDGTPAFFFEKHI